MRGSVGRIEGATAACVARRTRLAHDTAHQHQRLGDGGRERLLTSAVEHGRPCKPPPLALHLRVPVPVARDDAQHAVGGDLSLQCEHRRAVLARQQASPRPAQGRGPGRRQGALERAEHLQRVRLAELLDGAPWAVAGAGPPHLADALELEHQRTGLKRRHQHHAHHPAAPLAAGLDEPGNVLVGALDLAAERLACHHALLVLNHRAPPAAAPAPSNAHIHQDTSSSPGGRG